MKNYQSLPLIQEDIRNGAVTCVQLVEHHLNQIKTHNDLNVFLEVYEHEALDQAKIVDDKIKDGIAGKLAGLVVGIKDVLAYQDHGLQAGSKILDGFKSQFTGTAVQRLLDEDAIIIGRQNCDEFAMGSSNENSAFGPVKNGANPNRVPGGSSGGSAVAVQMDMCQVSLGTDTGGSVRQPAAFCGVIGLKPTYSRISRYGLAAYASSFDTIGTLSKSIDDAAITMEVMSGKDDYDSTVSHEEVPAYFSELGRDVSNYRVAFIEETLGEGLNPEIKAAVLKVLDLLRNDGISVEEGHFSMLDYLLPTYYILTTAEASSNLSRYDGVKYGYRSPNGDNLEKMYKLTRNEGFGEEVKRRIMLGTFVLSASYHDAFYTKAQKARRLIKESTEKLLSDHDFLVLPTTPTTAFELGSISDSLEMYLADLYTVQASVSGIPAISIPFGTDKDGLPIGVQIMSKHFTEDKLLAFSKYILELNR
ncbi:MAG: Asp-tRNA(Asn)/Glu-tRNA(Gln) amidotransferase subunit GatA [bacterium]|nr:Asp-tRNA(Asn)/Glu-tRNA(Gln) amidotransferase subunit GatA [bacterium]